MMCSLQFIFSFLLYGLWLSCHLPVLYISRPVTRCRGIAHFIKHSLLTTAYIPAPAYVMSVLLTTAYIRKRVCRHFREAVYAGSPQHPARHL